MNYQAEVPLLSEELDEARRGIEKGYCLLEKDLLDLDLGNRNFYLSILSTLEALFFAAYEVAKVDEVEKGLVIPFSDDRQEIVDMFIEVYPDEPEVREYYRKVARRIQGKFLRPEEFVLILIEEMYNFFKNAGYPTVLRLQFTFKIPEFIDELVENPQLAKEACEIFQYMILHDSGDN